MDHSIDHRLSPAEFIAASTEFSNITGHPFFYDFVVIKVLKLNSLCQDSETCLYSAGFGYDSRQPKPKFANRNVSDCELMLKLQEEFLESSKDIITPGSADFFHDCFQKIKVPELLPPFSAQNDMRHDLAFFTE